MKINDEVSDCPEKTIKVGDVFRHSNSYVMIVKTATGISLVDLKNGDQTWGVYPNIKDLLFDLASLRDAKVRAGLNIKGLA